MEKSDISGVLPSLRASQLLRILLIGFLILLLQIPIGMIRGVISERKMTRQEATEEVTSKWGMEQSVVGPIVTIPYLRKWVETTSDGKRQSRSQVRFAYFLPDELKVSGRVKSEVRYRGIFKVPVYRMSLTLQGRFSKPDFSGWDIEAENILWDRAYLSVGISDARAIQNQARLSWNEEQISFSPGTGETGGGNPGINASLDSHMSGKSFEFSFPLVLNGSVGVFFVPFGEETKVDLESDWSEPSFRGNWLPSERLVDSKGFHATWNIPSLGRNYSQKWRTGTDVSKAISASRFGVGFISPVDHYRMAQRSVKYDVLFLLLTFLTLWLFEVLAGVRIHSMQYLLVGAGMCLFFLLELSLSEHIGFVKAYVLASTSIVALLFAYSVAVLKGVARGAIVGALVAILYGYLFILLRNQDYALLVGSIGLFVILAAVMYLTRKVDWYAKSG
jgi:inner membrane protein